MKRIDLLKHLRRHGCFLARTDGPHDIWVNERLRLAAPIPRHRELNTITGKKICTQLGVPVIEKR